MSFAKALWGFMGSRVISIGFAIELSSARCVFLVAGELRSRSLSSRPAHAAACRVALMVQQNPTKRRR